MQAKKNCESETDSNGKKVDKKTCIMVSRVLKKSLYNY